ncbi:MAG: hypothetical protein HKN04_00115 [Rhodothermaceae bacterium]|nr:hypothetical protein [Rhodothermaceae bacterium]
MSTERRYDEREVAAIFERAAEAEAREEPLAGEGLTLRELQRIGAEAGLSPAHIAEAAAVLDRDPPSSDLLAQTLGAQRAVYHSVRLPAPLTDADWEQLVAQFRSTFDANGKTTREGSLRTWANGNLRVGTEPTGEGGQRLRFSTRNASLSNGITGGLVNMVAGLVLFAVFALFDPAEPIFPVFALQFVLGAMLAGSCVVRLKPWAQERAEQFDRLGAQAIALTAGMPEAATVAAEEHSEPPLALDALPEPPVDEPIAPSPSWRRSHE